MDRILLNLQEGDQDDTKRKESISYLKNMSVDAIFAKEFFAKKGNQRDGLRVNIENLFLVDFTISHVFLRIFTCVFAYF